MNRKQEVKEARVMYQVVTVNLRLYPTKIQEQLLSIGSMRYIGVINSLISEMVESRKTTKKTSKDVKVLLNSAVKNQAIKDAKSIFNKKVKKSKYKIIPVLKKPIIVWNNQNYALKDSFISVPFIVKGKSTRTSIRVEGLTDRNLQLLSNKLGALRVTRKGSKWIAQIAVTLTIEEQSHENAMGVDLGLKVPAVVVTEKGKTKFCGNGRENKYKKRKFRAKRKELGKAKKLKALKKLDNKEQRWMKDKDHKVSREIINFAIENNVSVIRLEKLANIRNTARTSRKNAKNLHTWSFYRLASFIAYKATLVGIQIEYVDPRYTSQTCPSCSKRNKAKDRTYLCTCGYHTHRDRVGAINIITAPVLDGNSLTA